jgi:hypothetical protein
VTLLFEDSDTSQENAMDQFTAKYCEQIQGVLSGFDRLVLRGSPRRLSYAQGMEEYLWQNRILFKDYAAHVKRVSERIKKASLEPFRRQGLAVEFIRSMEIDKEAVARGIAESRGIQTGLVCAISSLEPSPTYEHSGTAMVARVRPCHVLYHYQIHPQFGWMHARIQSWFPFHIQVCVNGREWLARQMDEAGLRYRKQGNCFVSVQDYERAQQLLNQQLRTNWVEMLEGFADQLNPVRRAIFDKYPTEYYWTCYQSEWATDVVFKDAEYLKRLMRRLLPHGLLNLSSGDILRFLGKKVNMTGEVPGQFGGKLQSDLKRRQEGSRLKFVMNGNSVKCYDKAFTIEGSVLRAAETTINNVKDFRVYRSSQDRPDRPSKWWPMRKGVADLHRRVEVSQASNARLMNALTSVDDTRTMSELTGLIQQPTIWKCRRVRALRPWGEDATLLKAISDGAYLVNGFRNRDIRDHLYPAEADTPAEQRKLSAAVSRRLRMLRAHGLIQKVPKTHRYQVSTAGRTILAAVLTTARTSLRQLDSLSEKAA